VSLGLDDVMLALVEVVGVGAPAARCRRCEFGCIANGNLWKDLAQNDHKPVDIGAGSLELLWSELDASFRVIRFK
jgi:hypothetical protein